MIPFLRRPFPGRISNRKTAPGLFLLFLLAFPAGAGAQIALGIQGGLGSFKVKGDAPKRVGYAGSWGGTASLVLDWEVTRGVAVSVQPSWTQKGAGVTVEVKGVREPVDSAELKLTYLSLPVLMKVTTSRGKAFVTAGVDLGYLKAGILTLGDSQEIDVENALETGDVSALFGVGGTLRRGRPTVTFEFRYNQSLLRVLNPSEQAKDTSLLPQGFRSSGVQLIAGVLFPLGGGDR